MHHIIIILFYNIRAHLQENGEDLQHSTLGHETIVEHGREDVVRQHTNLEGEDERQSCEWKDWKVQCKQQCREEVVRQHTDLEGEDERQSCEIERGTKRE